MLTPQEIQDKKFEKSVFNGYDMEQIDRFLDTLLPDYTSLYKENATLKAKMRVLVDKIEEYRAVDEEMRKALYTAQMTAKSIVECAKTEAERITGSAHAEAEQKTQGVRLEIATEEARLAQVKASCADYAGKIKALLLKNVQVVDNIVQSAIGELPKATEQAEQIEPTPAVTASPSVSYDTGAVITEVSAMLNKIDSKDYSHFEKTQNEQEPMAQEPQATVTEELKPDARRAVVTNTDSYTSGNMETKFFEIDLDAAAKDDKKSESQASSDDTAKIYGDSVFTPKPRFNFSDLRFGRGYKEDREEENDD